MGYWNAERGRWGGGWRRRARLSTRVKQGAGGGGGGGGAREMRMGQLRQRGVIGKLETGHVDCLYSRRVIALHNLAGP